MRKRRKNSLKNIILKGVMGTAFTILLLSGAALDSDYWMEALAVFMVSFAILAMFAIANGAMGGDWDER
jgi:uncharacterized membrane protein (GlpM family)